MKSKHRKESTEAKIARLRRKWRKKLADLERALEESEVANAILARENRDLKEEAIQRNEYITAQNALLPAPRQNPYPEPLGRHLDRPKNTQMHRPTDSRYKSHPPPGISN